MIKWQIDTIRSSNLGELVVATSMDPSDDILVDYLDSLDVQIYRGSLLNVYDRFKNVVLKSKQSTFMRLTADCPLIDPEVMFKVFSFHEESNLFDYSCNTLPPTFPHGQDVEVFSKKAFLNIESLKMTEFQMEHVTPGFYQNQSIFRCGNLSNSIDLSHMRWTVDVLDDFLFVEKVLREISTNKRAPSMNELLQYLHENPEHSREKIR